MTAAVLVATLAALCFVQAARAGDPVARRRMVRRLTGRAS